MNWGLSVFHLEVVLTFEASSAVTPVSLKTPVGITERDRNGVPQRDDDNSKISVYRLFLGWLVEGS